MKFAVVVNEGPYQHQAANTAYHFTRSVLEKGHEVVRVFFYHDGVNNGTCLTAPPQDEPQIVNQWTRLGRAHDLDLVICVAAAQRRGIMDEREPARHDAPLALQYRAWITIRPQPRLRIAAGSYTPSPASGEPKTCHLNTTAKFSRPTRKASCRTCPNGAPSWRSTWPGSTTWS